MDSPTFHTPNGRTPLLRATDEARALLRRAELLLAALAVLIAVPIGLLAASTSTTAAGPVGTGLVAGLGTLAACWSLLGLAGTLWRSRLAARDARETAREWARVEPRWSRRTV